MERRHPAGVSISVSVHQGAAEITHPYSNKQIAGKHQRLPARLVLAVMLVLGISIFSMTLLAAPPITESFRNATASGWIISGSAILTSGDPDSAGDGWLRLTNTGKNQAGSAIYDVAFSSTDGTEITFYYATWGGTHADGISFYLIDGSVSPTVGGTGGALGYAWKHVPSDGFYEPGVTGGVLGVGLDEWGNFANNLDVDADPYGTGGIGRSSGLTIRGPGNLHEASPGFPYLTREEAIIETGDRANVKRVEITITPSPTQSLTVKLDGATLISNYSISAYTMPTTLKMGFSSSTGGFTNYHEIRDLSVTGAIPTTTTVLTEPDPSILNAQACFKATVLPMDATGTVTFLEGTTVLGTGTITVGIGIAELWYSDLTLGGPHTITARYEGDSKYAGSSGTDPHVVINPQPEIDVQRPASIPDGGTDDVGDAPVGATTLVYTIGNTAGTAQLDLTCGTAANYFNSSGFAVVSALPINIAAGGMGTLQVSFDITMIGPFSFDMHIDNNDANEDPYDITIEGVGLIDLNGDGKDDVLDVRLLFAHVEGCGCDLLSGAPLGRADIDLDGDVDIDDARMYAEYVIGIQP